MAVKDVVLEALRDAADTFISGEDLSCRLGVSRTSVWKAIKKLREEGYPIEAVTNKGYMMVSESRTITGESLRLSLPARYRKNAIYIYDTIDSTNVKAKQLAAEGAIHGTIVLAKQQTSGRGRLGRSFFSPREGIYMSLVLKPLFGVDKAMLVTSAAAVAVAEAVENVCQLPATIKWVNDICLEGKKLCGISAEAVTSIDSGEIESMIIGIGINTSLKGFPEELLDIAAAADGDYSRAALAAEVITRLLDMTGALGKANNREQATPEKGKNDVDAFMESYRRHSIVIGKNIKVYKGGYRKDITDESTGIPARALGIDQNGGLEVIYTDGRRETLNTGEVSIR